MDSGSAGHKDDARGYRVENEVAEKLVGQGFTDTLPGFPAIGGFIESFQRGRIHGVGRMRVDLDFDHAECAGRFQHVWRHQAVVDLCPGFGSVERPINSPAGAGIQGLRLVGVDVDGDDHEDFDHAVHAFDPGCSGIVRFEDSHRRCGENMLARSRNEFDFMDDRSNGHPFQALALRYPLVAAVKAFKDRIAFGAGVHVGGKQGIDGKRNHARMSHAF